jgi:hypothetical protein
MQTKLYDTLTCVFPLAGVSAAVQALEFRTKDFARQLDAYRIEATGRLVKIVGGTAQPVALTGVVKFGAMLNKKWHKFEAEFGGGLLVSVRRAGKLFVKEGSPTAGQSTEKKG